MKKNKVGNSELLVSIAGFGCMSLGDDESSAIALLQEAAEKGINFFDTANIYNDGLNEEILGKAFKTNRNNIIIATKVGNQRLPDGSLQWNPTKKHIFEEVEKSLQRLQTDYIDLYQLHGGTIEDTIEEIIEAFEKLQSEGKIRYYGISSIRPNVIREYVKKSRLVSVLMQYSLLDQRPEEACTGLLKESNTGLLCRGALAQGILSGKPASSYLNRSLEEVNQIIEGLTNIKGRSIEEIAIQYLLAEKAVTSVVTGIRTRKHLHDFLNAVNAVALTNDELKEIKSMITANYYTQQR